MRLKSGIWVQAYIRNCNSNAVPAMVVHKGDADAGAIYIKVNCLDGFVLIYGPAPQGFEDQREGHKWCLCCGSDPVSESEADAYCARQRNMDRDIWVIELEDREKRHFLDDQIVDL